MRMLFLHAREMSEEIHGIIRSGNKARNMIDTRSAMRRDRSARSRGCSTRVDGLTWTYPVRTGSDYSFEGLRVRQSTQGMMMIEKRLEQDFRTTRCLAG